MWLFCLTLQHMPLKLGAWARGNLFWQNLVYFDHAEALGFSEIKTKKKLSGRACNMWSADFSTTVFHLKICCHPATTARPEFSGTERSAVYRVTPYYNQLCAFLEIMGISEKGFGDLTTRVNLFSQFNEASGENLDDSRTVGHRQEGKAYEACGLRNVDAVHTPNKTNSSSFRPRSQHAEHGGRSTKILTIGGSATRVHAQGQTRRCRSKHTTYNMQ